MKFVVFSGHPTDDAKYSQKRLEMDTGMFTPLSRCYPSPDHCTPVFRKGMRYRLSFLQQKLLCKHFQESIAICPCKMVPTESVTRTRRQGVLIFPDENLLHFYSTDEFPSTTCTSSYLSRQNHPPNSRGQGQYIFPTMPSANDPPPGSKNSANACLCDSQTISFVSFFQKNSMGVWHPPHPHVDAPVRWQGDVTAREPKLGTVPI